MTPTIAVSAGDTIKKVSALMLQRGVQALPVNNEDGRNIGIVTEADMLRNRSTPDPRQHANPSNANSKPLPHTVSEVMTQDVISLPDSADESDFAQIMLAHGLGAVPVVAQDRVVGMVTRRDLLSILARDDADIRADVLAELTGLPGDWQGWDVEVLDGSVRLRGAASDPVRRAAEQVARTVPGVTRAYSMEPCGSEVTDAAGLRVLTLDECLARLRSVPIGRVAFVAEGEPMIVPVNHVMDGSGVAFRTTSGSKLFAAERGSAVAFEVDSYESARRGGWSVLVRGVMEKVYDAKMLTRLETWGLRPWADAVERPTWIRILGEEISGREIIR